MLQSVGYYNNQFIIYDNSKPSFDFYTPNQIKKIYDKGITIDKQSTFELFLKANLFTDYTKTFKQLDDIGLTVVMDTPYFVIRRKMKIPKLPMNMGVYYKGLHFYVQNTKVQMREYYPKSKEKEGKQFVILPNSSTDINVKYYLTGYDFNETPLSYQEYDALLQELFSCLTYDRQVLMYTINIVSQANDIDLTAFHKTYKIGRFNVAPTYQLKGTNNVEILKVQDLYYLDTFVPIIDEGSKKLNLIDCTQITAISLESNATILRLIRDFIKGRAKAHILIVFNNSSKTINDLIVWLNSISQYFQVVNLGDIKNTSDAMIQLRKQQSKYSLYKTGHFCKYVLIANLI